MHAITGTPKEKPQPNIMTLIDLKYIFYDWYYYNKELFVIINKIGNISYLPYFLKIISKFFNIEIFAIYFFIAIPFLNKNLKNSNNIEKKFEYYFDRYFRIGLAYASIGLIYAFLKFTVNLPRPFCSLETGIFNSIMDFSNIRCLSSFPSAHTALSFLVLYSFWDIASNYIRSILVINLILVMFARISLAMHFPSDLLYSVIISFMVIKISEFIYYYFKENIIKWFKDSIYTTFYKE